MSHGSAPHRGDLVIVDFRSVNPRLGVRPALVIQNDADNARMRNTIVIQVTSNTHRAAEPTQLLIDQQHPDWSSTGLHRPSVINCSNIYTAEQQHIARVIGRLSAATMREVGECLQTALGLASS